jgi:hypothetical protein
MLLIGSCLHQYWSVGESEFPNAVHDFFCTSMGSSRSGKAKHPSNPILRKWISKAWSVPITPKNPYHSWGRHLCFGEICKNILKWLKCKFIEQFLSPWIKNSEVYWSPPPRKKIPVVTHAYKITTNTYIQYVEIRYERPSPILRTLSSRL